MDWATKKILTKFKKSNQYRLFSSRNTKNENKKHKQKTETKKQKTTQQKQNPLDISNKIRKKITYQLGGGERCRKRDQRKNLNPKFLHFWNNKINTYRTLCSMAKAGLLRRKYIGLNKSIRKAGKRNRRCDVRSEKLQKERPTTLRSQKGENNKRIRELERKTNKVEPADPRTLWDGASESKVVTLRSEPIRKRGKSPKQCWK